MEPDSQKPRQQAAASCLKIRLAWWFGLYFAAQVPLALYIRHFWDLRVIHIIALTPYFPIGLGWMISSHVVYNLPARFQGSFTQFCDTYLPYLIYLTHFGTSLLVRSKRVFYFLMLALIVILVLSLSSCASEIPISDN